MTAPEQENQPQNTQEVKQNDKEYNFRQLEAKLAQERQARLEAERIAQEALARKNQVQEEDEDEGSDEPYVDHKRLNKKLNRFNEATKSEIQKAMEIAKQHAKEELKQELYLEQNPDFFDTLKHAETFAQRNPRLAETILRMPEGFDRQKLVYENIKAMGIDKPQPKQSDIQQKVDNNRKSPYYQPSNVGSSPYAQVGDFSAAGQKNAYQKMKEMQKQFRA